MACAADAAPGNEPARIDPAWRERYVWGVDAELARNVSRAWERAQKAYDAARLQNDPRTQLQAAIFYFSVKLNDDSQDCRVVQPYVAMARAGGKAFEAELFDLGIATGLPWIDRPCPGQITMDELEALARRLGDPARMFYLLKVKAHLAFSADRFAEAVSLRIQQLDYAVTPFQKASTLLLLVNTVLSVDRQNFESVVGWLERARQEIDPEAFQSLARLWETAYAVVEFRRGNVEAALAHVRRMQRLLRLGAASSQNAAISLVSCAGYLNQLNRGREAVELLDQSRAYGVDDPYTRMNISAEYLRAYAALRTPQAWTKGEQEVRQVSAWLEDPSDNLSARTDLLDAMADFYERFGRHELALQARKKLQAAMLQVQRTANDKTRVELQEKLAVAFKDKENAQLKAEAELRDARQRGWIVAFGIAVLGVVGVGGALAVALRQRQRLARVSAELAQRNGELEQRSASRIRLLAAACHDLRQPAHALGMLAELGSEARREDTRFAAWLQSVRRSAASLGDMLDELMDLGRLDGGHYQPLLSDVPLGELMQEVMLHFGPLARRKGLSLEAPPVELTVVSDRHLLRRILFNLVSNAIKYTDAGAVSILVAAEGAQARLTVQDTGPGIPPDKLDDVFRDYVRLNPLKAAEGLGIGLSIVRRAAELLGHPLSLRSEPGQGTAVSLSLPVSAAPRGDMPPRAAEAAGASTGALIAVMEDDVDVRDAMTALLARWGYRVVAGADASSLLATRGEQALVPALVITDLHLDGSNGLTEVERLRQALQAPTLPALLVTGDLDETVTRQAAQARVFVAHKPLPPDKLAGLIRQVLDRADEPGSARPSGLPPAIPAAQPQA